MSVYVCAPTNLRQGQHEGPGSGSRVQEVISRVLIDLHVRDVNSDLHSTSF